VVGHVFGALVERQVVPVVLGVAALAHRVETDVAVVREIRVDPRPDVLREAGVVVDLALEVVAGAFGVPRRLGDGDVRTRPLGEPGERRPFERPLERVEVAHRRAEVDEHEVGLVADDAEDGGVAAVGVDALDRFEVLDALLHGAVPLAVGGRAPRVPVDRPEVVEYVPALFRRRGISSVHARGFGRTE